MPATQEHRANSAGAAIAQQEPPSPNVTHRNDRMRGVHVPADHAAPVRVVELPGPDPSQASRFVGAVASVIGVESGWLDATTVHREVRAWVDDVGLTRAPVNERATAFRDRGAAAAGSPGHAFPSSLHGDVVLVGRVQYGNESEAPGWLLKLVEAGEFDAWCAA